MPRRIHVIAMGGAAMSGLAEILRVMGHDVSGCDAQSSPVLERLQAAGIPAVVGHDRSHVEGADLVAVSTAIPPGHPEVEAARAAGTPVYRRTDVLAALCAQRRTIAVAGTHGKTTTSAMLASLLAAAGRHPSFVVGGEIVEFGTGARWGEGEWLVAEADESDGTFLRLSAEVAVVTSVEPDHLEHWGGFPALIDAFERFLTAAKAQVVCGDDEVAAGIARRHGLRSYGFEPGNDVRITSYEGRRGGCRFTVETGGAAVDVALPVGGRHNARNATAALLAAEVAGVAIHEGAEALRAYRGVARRAHVRGERDGVTFLDEYAHLPGEVAASLAAAREGGWNRIVCVFQPHRYSRTQALWRAFGTAFEGAHVLAVTDVYPAGEAPRPGVTGKLVVDAVLEANPHRRVAWLPDRAGIVTFLRRELRPGDLCLTLGAGDLTTLADELLGGGA